MTNRLRYDDLLKTAEWRVFSYECKESAGFRCAFCDVVGADKLQTHHWWYEATRFPWEVERGQVAVMCAECHGVLHREWETLKRYVLAHGGETPAMREGLRWFRRWIFAGLTPEGFTRLNARLLIGTEGTSETAANAARVLAGIVTVNDTHGSERELNAGRS